MQNNSLLKNNYQIKEYHFEGSNTSRYFSSGKYYQILLITGGDCQVKIQNTLTTCGPEFAIFMKPGHKIQMNYHFTKVPCEIISLRVTKECLQLLSDLDCDLLKSFSFLPVNMRFIHLNSRNYMLIKNISRNLLLLPIESDVFGYQLYEKNILSMLLVLILRACIQSDQVYLSHHRKHLVMDDIFIYIKEHLTEDLSLEALEKKFHVSRYHICREFKRLTGQTLHAYIVKTRLDLCKRYINEGKSIREVYVLGGFGGYNHFFRAFKKEYGMTPGEYYHLAKK